MGWRLEQGDCLEVLRSLAPESVSSLVTDPPAGIDFMGREWDNFAKSREGVSGMVACLTEKQRRDRDNFIAFMTGVMKEAMRVLKPGSMGLVWAIPRTSHWTATALEDAGFEIRDVITHHFGSGFPKSQDVGKFIDKLAGAEREVIGVKPGHAEFAGRQTRGHLDFKEGTEGYDRPWMHDDAKRAAYHQQTAPTTDEAKAWDGWGTALKPATEHWILVRKPLSESSIARNVLKHGVGALNIDESRVERAAADVPGWHKTGAQGSGGYQGEDTFKIRDMSAEEIQERCGNKGRWPTNLLLSHAETCGFEDGECAPDCPVAELDRQSGMNKSSGHRFVRKRTLGDTAAGWGMRSNADAGKGYGDSGGASRFFPTFHYFAKPSRSEREAGLDQLPDRTLNRVNPGGLENEPRFAPIQVKNNHPTVKGKKLMTWLIKLVTPAGGCVLDPFAGSGSTGVAALAAGFSFLGIEQDAGYYQIAEARIQFAAAEAAGQQSLFDEDEL